MSRLWLCLFFCASCTVFGGFTGFVCGDGILQDFEGEACDDGNTAAGDGCAADCLFEVCGNGRLDPSEACDDGNVQDGDGCRADCAGTEQCGDGLLDTSEQCDDGNGDNGDGCDENCTPTACQNGVISAGEVCFSENRKDFAPAAILPSMVSADFDNDGDIDIAAVENVNDRVLLFSNDGAAQSFTIHSFAVGDSPTQLVAADLDQDGDLDLVALNAGDDTLSVLQQVNNNFLPQVVLTTPLATLFHLRVADIDGNGLLDMAVSSTENQIAFLRQVAAMQFQPVLSNGLPRLVTVNPGIFSFALADWNGDGREDLFVSVAETPGRVRVLFQSASTAFSFLVEEDIALGQRTGEIKALDIDMDGDNDILVIDQDADTLILVRNQLGLFEIPETLLASSDVRDFLVVDLNSDVLPEIVFSSFFRPEFVFQQQQSDGFSLNISHLNFIFLTATAGDYNGDGAMDIALFGAQETPPGDTLQVSLFLAEP